jgi:hypothetical protein
MENMTIGLRNLEGRNGKYRSPSIIEVGGELARESAAADGEQMLDWERSSMYRSPNFLG